MMRIAQLAPLAESVPPKFYGGTERVVAWLPDEAPGVAVETDGSPHRGSPLGGPSRAGQVSSPAAILTCG